MGDETNNPLSPAGGGGSPQIPILPVHLWTPLPEDLPAAAPNLTHPLPKPAYQTGNPKFNEREPDFADYPEFSSSTSLGYLPVYPDDFRGLNPVTGQPIQNEIMPEVSSAGSILGGQLVVRMDNKFEHFLLVIQQLCRNYNKDLYDLRGVLYKIRITLQLPPAAVEPAATNFRQSALRLAGWLARHDRRYSQPAGGHALGERYCAKLAVEFVKINGYIASIRAGATEPMPGHVDPAEMPFSSSSHISISSMFSSNWP